jgi:hypothetical protein
MKVLIIKTDDSVEVVDAHVNLKWLQNTVGGYIEGFYGRSSDWHGYCNEEGKLKSLPINQLATAFARELGWPGNDVLVGDVVFLGTTSGGSESSVPSWVLDELHHYLGG